MRGKEISMKNSIGIRFTIVTATMMGIAASTAAPPTAANTNNVVGRAMGKQSTNIGTFEEAKQVIGGDLKDSQNKSVGKIDDVVVDLESGKILYVIGSVSGGSDHVAIAPSVLVPQPTGKSFLITADQTKLAGAPKVDLNQTNDLGNAGFVGQVFQAYGVPAQFEPNGSFNNVHKASQLYSLAVKDVANADFGKIEEVILDLHTAHVPFVVLTRSGASYAIPPNAFTSSPDKGSLVTGLDQKTLGSAPRYAKGQTQLLSNRATAAAIYNHYGKQPYFNTQPTLSPTSRTNTPSQIFPTK